MSHKFYPSSSVFYDRKNRKLEFYRKIKLSHKLIIWVAALAMISAVLFGRLPLERNV